MKLKKMIARVFRALPSLPPGTMGEPEIVDLLNEGLKNIALLTKKTTMLPYDLDEDSDSIPFPEDMIKLVNVFWSDDKTELMAGIGKSFGDETGDPLYYYVEDGRIVVRPIPTTDDSLWVEYVRQPTELKDDDDEPDIEGSSEYIISFALHRIHLEASSPAIQLWEMERYRTLSLFMETVDDNYQTPFRVVQSW